MHTSDPVVRHLTPNSAAQELSLLAFASLRRRDQRRKAEQYVRGLLEVPGRKSMRGIATLAGDKSLEQSLQHFVSSSTWQWTDMRAPLARYLEDALLPSAWVVRPLLIPKAGSHSVGVARRRLPGPGRTLNCQEAYGIWLAREEAAVPVHWELHLPPAWLEDPERRRYAGIPGHLHARSPLDTAVATARQLDCWTLGRRPVVFDCGEDAAHAAASQLAASPLSFLVRAALTSPVLTPADTALSGYRRQPVSARQVMHAAQRMRRPVEWIDPASGMLRTSLVAKVPVALGPASKQHRSGGGELPRHNDAAYQLPNQPGRLSLIGEWEHPFRRLSNAWLTDLTDAPVDALLRLTKLTRRVDRDLVDIADRVGLRDFEGRTYAGWHRHTTLASVAHAVVALSAGRIDGGPLRHPADAPPRRPVTHPSRTTLRTG